MASHLCVIQRALEESRSVFPSPKGRGFKVRDLIQRAIFSRATQDSASLFLASACHLRVIPSEAEGPPIFLDASRRTLITDQPNPREESRPFFPSPCEGEDQVEGPITARDSYRARFRILRLYLFRPSAISVSSRPKHNDPEILSPMNCLAHSWGEADARPARRVRDQIPEFFTVRGTIYPCWRLAFSMASEYSSSFAMRRASCSLDIWIARFPLPGLQGFIFFFHIIDAIEPSRSGG
jgi:hypothetical protein